MKQRIEEPISKEGQVSYGKRESFAEMAASQRPRIFRFLLASVRDPDLAETLTQECLLRALRHWPHFRGDSSVSTWLMRIAINLQKDFWRNRRMRFWREVHKNAVDPVEASDWLPSRESSPEARALARERIEQVWQVVESLSGKQRTVFLLRYVEELKLTEIAEATGMSEGTVKAFLWRALRKLRAAMTEADAAGPCALRGARGFATEISTPAHALGGFYKTF